jgi:hypothetical protein
VQISVAFADPALGNPALEKIFLLLEEAIGEGSDLVIP